jgi:hypothetical protein
MTTLVPLLAAGSLLCLALACRAHARERERRRIRELVQEGMGAIRREREWRAILDGRYNCRSTMVPAIPRDDDPEAPIMTEEACARLGHATISTHRGGLLLKSCPRCGASERVGYRDFDARR